MKLSQVSFRASTCHFINVFVKIMAKLRVCVYPLITVNQIWYGAVSYICYLIKGWILHIFITVKCDRKDQQGKSAFNERNPQWQVSIKKFQFYNNYYYECDESLHFLFRFTIYSKQKHCLIAIYNNILKILF
jgi:hypothetical protein